MSIEQRRLALARANDIRIARADLKRRIASGEVTVARVLLDTPREAQGWPVAGLLMAQWRWGTTRARLLLARNRIPELKPTGQLTDRQKRVLVSALGHGAGEGEGNG